MHDLIYADESAQEIVKANYPTAKIEDASDEIHQERFSIEMEVEQDEYFHFLLDSGLALASFRFQLCLDGKPEVVKPIIDDWLKSQEKTE